MLPSRMQTGIVLSHRLWLCALTEIFLVCDAFLFHLTQFHFFWTPVNILNIQYPWPRNTWSTSLCSEPAICQLHLSPLRSGGRQTSSMRISHCSPFPLVLNISTAQSSHSKDNKSWFIESFTCAEALPYLFFFISLHCTFYSSIHSFSRWADGTIQVTGFCSAACFVLYSPHNHPQCSVSLTTVEHRDNAFMELPVIIPRFFSWMEIAHPELTATCIMLD